MKIDAAAPSPAAAVPGVEYPRKHEAGPGGRRKPKRGESYKPKSASQNGP